MGAWGYGPFDSDNSLDYLGDLVARAGADQDPDTGNITASAGARAEAARLLQVTLEPVVDPGWAFDEFDGQWWNAYAAAGLVAAAKAGVPRESSGTTLLSNIANGMSTDLVGLANHCGYVRLLDEQVAPELVELARAAAAQIRKGVVDEWADALAALEGHLTN